ncbi:hypothetical protein [Kitasatospora paranensis]|uniref:Uncharacterized protein n=1 Tax=Kitasatospora paranensis TaxID=258053 RepID=A0ABW2FXR7_9ACTN
MREILGEVAAAAGGGLLRDARARRAERRLRAGLPVRIPCSARSERPGRSAGHVAGWLQLGPGGAVFRPRRGPALELPLGGSFHAPEPDAWYDAHWSATVYRPPGDGGPVHLCLPARCLPAVSGHLRAGAGGEAL